MITNKINGLLPAGTSVKVKVNIPDKLIFNKGDRYNMFSLSSKKLIGTMKAAPEYVSNDDFYPGQKECYKSFSIDLLDSYPPRQGTGTLFIRFAKFLSKKFNCEGRIHVFAWNVHNHKKTSAVFYRKQGFSSVETAKLIKVDEAIKKNIDVSPEDCEEICMYFPLDKYSK